MGGLELTWRLLGGVVLFAGNGFWVSTEFALTRLRQFSKEELDFSDPGIQKAWDMTETLEIYLTGCQIGIGFTSVLLGVITEPAVTWMIEWLFGLALTNPATAHGVSITLSVILINIAHTIWAEQTPTYLGIEKARFILSYCAIPHYYWTKLIYPLLWIGDHLTKATLALFGVRISRSWLEKGEAEATTAKGDIREQLIEVLESEDISSDRRDEVIKAYEIGDLAVGKIMVPRSEIISLSTQKSFEENLELVKRHMHARYPLVGESTDEFIGILYTPEILAHTKELLQGEKELDDFDWQRMIIPDTMTVSDLIDAFQDHRHELALVENAEQEIVGLVTLTDALEAIVGSAEDPLDVR